MKDDVYFPGHANRSTFHETANGLCAEIRHPLVILLFYEGGPRTDRYKWSYKRPPTYKWPKINGISRGYYLTLLLTGDFGPTFVNVHRYMEATTMMGWWYRFTVHNGKISESLVVFDASFGTQKPFAWRVKTVCYCCFPCSNTRRGKDFGLISF